MNRSGKTRRFAAKIGAGCIGRPGAPSRRCVSGTAALVSPRVIEYVKGMRGGGISRHSRMSARRRAAVNAIIDYLRQSRDVVQAAIDDPAFIAATAAAAETMVDALAGGHKILLAGNGGSAGDAQHVAGEFLARLNFDRAPIAALALTTDSSVLTAIANDYGYERIFERQIQALGKPGDVFVALSTSGRSRSILRAVEAARDLRLTVVGFTGRTGGEMRRHCDICLLAPSDSTPLIQQIHIIAGHIICGLAEERLFPRRG